MQTIESYLLTKVSIEQILSIQIQNKDNYTLPKNNQSKK